MQQVLTPDAPSATIPSLEPDQPGRAWSIHRFAEPIAVLALLVLAAAVRAPYLWDIPRFTDELQEVLWSVAIARGEITPLTAVDSYYGPLWSYLLAGLFVVFGPSPTLPRLVALLLSCGLVLLTYCFARDLAGRWPAAIAAGLMLTAGGSIVINSHTARSNNMTPLLTTAAIWLLYRSLATRRWDRQAGMTIGRRPDPRLLVPVGLLLGLALQTHLSVIALLPGAMLYGLWQGRTLLRTRWPWLAALGAVVGYSNMLIYNLLNNFWSFKHARSLQEGYTGGRSMDLSGYLANLGALLQSLSRLLSGTIDDGNSPARFLYLGLALIGLAVVTRRFGPLLGLACGSIVFVLPYFNPRYGPILSGRYLIPLLPIAFLSIGVLVVTLSRKLGGGWKGGTRFDWRAVTAASGLALAIFPLLPLYRYYQDALGDGRTNQTLYQLTEAIVSVRQPTELVLLDEGLAQEQLGAGGTDLKAYRMLLATHGIPYDLGKATDLDDWFQDGRASALFLMESKKRAALPRLVRATQVSAELESASGSEHRYAVFRVTER